MEIYMQAAIQEARKGLAEGGIPIGSVLVIEGKIVGRGHNRRVQKDSAIFHAEMDAIENAGRLSPEDYQKSEIYTTLSPCSMCSGAILLYKIPKVIVGEHDTFRGPEAYLKANGVKLTVMNNETCKNLMETFIKEHPDLWREDIGEI